MIGLVDYNPRCQRTSTLYGAASLIRTSPTATPLSTLRTTETAFRSWSSSKKSNLALSPQTSSLVTPPTTSHGSGLPRATASWMMMAILNGTALASEVSVELRP
ncbi:hypothetical protein BDY21DRAFT_164659 [Lineolata rhizophorae]|uniref:Uncharacterized protein n=1 Tax=Lineolata rhizophorae TaxID=578093 RepID=A0A6A6P926_9PEZI|nr:hypothetical protein BDY21DRAFT_164659 [Lineolata rhizophorae]